jgi:hypothetical protein
MGCIEGETLKNEVLDRIEEYLAAEQAQYTCSSFEEESTRARAERAHALLTDTRRRYWQHLKMHHCDSAAIHSVEASTLNAIAV